MVLSRSLHQRVIVCRVVQYVICYRCKVVWPCCILPAWKRWV